MNPVVPPPGGWSTAEILTANPGGFQLTHSMFRISDPEKSLFFYQDLLCMSQVFTLNAGPCTVYYLGYAGEGDMVPADLLKNETRSGLLELIHITAEDVHSEPGPDARCSNLGFGHLGFKVPDVHAVLKKAREGGWTVLKAPAENPDVAFGIHEGVKTSTFHESFAQMYARIGVIADPDGHCVELLPIS